MHRGQGKEEHDTTTRYRQGTGPPVKGGRGGGRREVDGDRQREREPWKGEPWGQQGPGYRLRT